MDRGAIDVVLLRIRDMQREMVIAVRLVEIDPVNAFRRSLIAFVFLRPEGRATQRHGISFQDPAILKQRQAAGRFLDENSVCHSVAGQGIKVQVSSRREPDNGKACDEKEDQEDFQPRCYCGSIGRRARGSRSFAVAVLGSVTNGPPSSGALSENATSGMLLGNPSSGNSFRSGK